ncbi:hypothetical protein SAMN06295905_0558 [Devosia lucknowensis]|uniref:Uncharacterized protein n=1 Tax=Devosia lucknowensis TaxID=1096929 RepID=A0A1Y6EH44_9HYPH|nr:hypothetical protein [Devosia lucknowensis]SMQ61699.1 hypothetical protein SAMN06295905_0558 [Devosia lucknowensis]
MFKGLIDRFGKKPPLPDIASRQEDAVRHVVADIVDLQDGEWDDRDWVMIGVNHEILAEEGMRSSTQAKVIAHRGDADLEALGFRLSMETKAKLLALRDDMTLPGEGPWTIVDLIIERSGTYNFAFSYGPPPRLNGDLLHSPLSDLLERYRAQQR